MDFNRKLIVIIPLLVLTSGFYVIAEGRTILQGYSKIDKLIFSNGQTENFAPCNHFDINFDITDNGLTISSETFPTIQMSKNLLYEEQVLSDGNSIMHILYDQDTKMCIIYTKSRQCSSSNPCNNILGIQTNQGFGYLFPEGVWLLYNSKKPTGSRQLLRECTIVEDRLLVLFRALAKSFGNLLDSSILVGK